MLDSPDVDFALAAFHVDGAWQVAEIAGTALVDLDTLAAGLRRFPADGGALAMIGLDEETFLLVRANGPRVRVLLSDVTAADEWDLARDVVEHLGLPFPEDEDDPEPAGDMELLADLGVQVADLGELLDGDLYADEVLSDIAARLGFGPAFDDAVGLTNA